MANPKRILGSINLEYVTNVPPFVEDIPGMRLTNLIGEYEFTTERKENKRKMPDGTVQAEHNFQITIKPLTSVAKLGTAEESLVTKSFSKAIKIHYAVMIYLNQIYPS